MTLREAIEHARDALRPDQVEERKHLQALLDQKSEGYDSLLDECEEAIYG